MMAGRPIFLNLWQIKLPIPALVSILHRISGVIVFLLLTFGLIILQLSLDNQVSFTKLSKYFNYPMVMLGLLIFEISFLFHILAGIRHLVMDLGFGDNKYTGKKSAHLILILIGIIFLAAILILLGVK